MLLLSDFSVICIKFRVTGIIDLTPTVYSLFNLNYIIIECPLLDVFKQNYYDSAVTNWFSKPQKIRQNKHKKYKRMCNFKMNK